MDELFENSIIITVNEPIYFKKTDVIVGHVKRIEMMPLMQNGEVLKRYNIDWDKKWINSLAYGIETKGKLFIKEQEGKYIAVQYGDKEYE